MTTSQRANALSASETLKITALAKEMQRAGKSVISLSAGEPDFKTPAHICDAAIQAIRDGHHGYTVNAGTPELRELVVAKLKRDNALEYTPEQIIVSNGAKQSVGFAILATVNPGDEVIIPAPYWVSYPEMVKLAEGVSVTIRTAFETDYKLTPAQLRAAITPKTKMLILCSPSNPTGSCYTLEEMKALAEVLLEYPDVLILSDEIYEYIVFDGEHVSIAQAEPRLKDRTIVVNGFSKGYAMTGWRLGYLAATKEIVGAVGKLQSQELNAIPGVRCFNPGGAFYVFPDVSAYLGKKSPDGTVIATSSDLCFYLIEAAGIATVPGDAFGEPDGLRLSYACSMADLEESVKRLRQGLETLS